MWHCCHPRVALLSPSCGTLGFYQVATIASIGLHICFYHVACCLHRVSSLLPSGCTFLIFSLAQTQPPSCGMRLTYGQQPRFFTFLSIVVALIYVVSHQSPHPVPISNHVVVDISLRSKFVWFYWDFSSSPSRCCSPVYCYFILDVCLFLSWGNPLLTPVVDWALSRDYGESGCSEKDNFYSGRGNGVATLEWGRIVCQERGEMFGGERSAYERKMLRATLWALRRRDSVVGGSGSSDG